MTAPDSKLHKDKKCFILFKHGEISYPVDIDLLKVNNRNSRNVKLWNIFKVNNKDDAIGVVLVSLMLTLNIFHTLF